MISKSRLGKNAIIGVVLLHFDVDGGCFRLKHLFTPDCRFGVKGDLWVVEYLSTGVIDIDGTAGVAIIGGVDAISCDETAMERGDIVTTGDAIAGRGVVDFEAHLFIGNRRTGSFVGATSLLSHAT
jgi:hypothetical protein